MNHKQNHKTFIPLLKKSKLKPDPPKQRPSVYIKTMFNTEFSSKLHLFLFLLYSGTSLNTLIPTSYLSIKSAQKKALFYYREGKLHMESEVNSFNKFFELTKESELRKYRQPKYIHFTSNSTYLYSDESEARDLIVDQQFSLLQKYIYSTSKYSKKMRICWNKEKGFNYWLVSNKNPLPKTEWFATELSLKPKNSLYKFNVTEFNYAGRLLKTSLSPFNLHSSKLKNSHALSNKKKLDNMSKLNNITRQQSMNKCSFSHKVYLTKQYDLENSASVNVHIRYGQLEGIIKDFLGMIERWREIVNASPVSEAYFDFIENSKGRWYMIGCKIKGVDLELLLQSVSLRKFIRTSTCNPYEVKKVEQQHSDEELIHKKFVDMKERLNSISIQHANYVSFDKSSGYSLYNSFSSSLCSPLSFQASVSRNSQLSPLAMLYDKTIMKAKELKKQARIHQEILKEYNSRKDCIQNIVAEIVASIENNEMFTGNIKFFGKHGGIHDFFDNCLQGNPPNNKSEATQLIKEIGVNKRNFQEFLLCIIGVLEKYYEEEFKDLLMYRIIENTGFNESS